MINYIFVTGGVMSSLGKGISASVLGFLLKSHGYNVVIRKFDPYLNIDSGTMNPMQHGEVFVTEDGFETDLDLGHYERFMDVNSVSKDAVTLGRVYYDVLNRERKGDYLGSTIQVIPHITDRIKELISYNISKDVDFLICELGGTVGDIEGLALMDAVRQISSGNDSGSRSMHIHLTYLPFIVSAQEFKTKPSQHFVKVLMNFGINPNILLCRCDREITYETYKKLSLFCNLKVENIIEAIDVSSIYEVPLKYVNNKLDIRVLEYFNKRRISLDMTNWICFLEKEKKPLYEVTIAIVIKYTSLRDAYKSIVESFTHSGVYNYTKVNIRWINAEDLEKKLSDPYFSSVDLNNISSYFKGANGILLPGGYGLRGSIGKMAAAFYARKCKIPFFGICFGMQLAVIEFARNVIGLKEASSSEFGKTLCPIISYMTRWRRKSVLELRGADVNLGGTMRLGSYSCKLIHGSLVYKVYGLSDIMERHRHRYELNILYREKLEEFGLVFSGVSPDGLLPEVVELKDHPWYLAMQFHPEFKSRPFKPHPVFNSFIRASLRNLHKYSCSCNN